MLDEASAAERAGDPALARRRYEELLAQWPEAVEARVGLARLLRKSGDPGGAETELKRAIAGDPEHAGPRFELGRLLLDNDRPLEALDALETGHRLDPADPRGCHLLGLMYLERGLLEPASRLLERAVEAAPGDANAAANLGLARQTAGDMDAAESAYRKALANAPGHPGALRGMARLADARQQPQEALDLLAPHASDGSADGTLLALYGGLLRSVGRGDEAIRLLEQRLPCFETEQERMAVHFRLGDLYDAAGEWAQAFRHYRAANDLKGAEFDPTGYEALVDRLLTAFNPARMAASPRAANADERPIFIVGMPRSGTSLVEQILASHPDVHGAGELNDVGLLALATASGGREYPESAVGMDQEALSSMAAAYLAKLESLAPAALRVTDKMWQNFEYLGLIALLFPAARVIHCRRGPLDTGLSCYRQHFFGAGVSFAYDLGHIGAYYRQYERVMGHWQQVLDLPILEVRYEELVTETEAGIRRMVDFAGLSWEEACLRFHETERAIRTASYAQVRRPVYQDSVGRHRHYDEWLGPLRAALAADG